MTLPETSPLFATDSTYPLDGDPWEGDPVRVDPGASRRAEGWEPDTLPAEWANFMTGVHGDWIEHHRRRRLASGLGTWTARTAASSARIKAIAERGVLPGLIGAVPGLPVDHFLSIVGSGGGDTIQASSDGSVWTASPGTALAENVADLAYLWSAGRWILVGGTTNGAILSRVAGNLATAWTTEYGPTLAPFTRVACSPGRAIAIGVGGRVSTSTNGTSWTALTPLAEEATDITYGGGIFVAVWRNYIWTTPDGSVWTLRYAEPEVPGAAPSRVAYDSTRDRFFVSSSASTPRLLTFLASAPDDVVPIFSIGQNVNDLTCVNGVLVLVAGNHARFSDDAGASFAYAYTGPTEASGECVAASDALSCVVVGGELGSGSDFLAQSARGL